MKTTARVRFRVITPGTFANLDGFNPDNGKGAYKAIETLEEAQEALRQFAHSDSEVPEYREYWKKRGEACKIVRVTEIIEEDVESEVDFLEETKRAFRNDANLYSSFSAIPIPENLGSLARQCWDEKLLSGEKGIEKPKQ